MVSKQKFSTRALRIHNWKVLSATLGHLELANITAESLVKEQSLIFCIISKFTGFVLLKEHYTFTHHLLGQLLC